MSAAILTLRLTCLGFPTGLVQQGVPADILQDTERYTLYLIFNIRAKFPGVFHPSHIQSL